MLNYGNLSDVEFEYLCGDIASRMFNLNLRKFGQGKDGGIDLTNNTSTYEVVIQVKHYKKSDVERVVSAIKSELKKVIKLKPKQYYVFCSRELSPQNIREIYEVFKQYMKSDKNIITIIEIDDFLNDSSNSDILNKHYKLWMSSANIIDRIISNDIYMDSFVLASNIKKSEKYFVKTQAFEESLKYLEKFKSIILVGNPGVGKTITSEMIVLYYLNMGYNVRYTSNSADLPALKKALSKREEKEIIFLDDCFGQSYFAIKESQGKELVSLIKYVELSSNKRLIMNSRITIYNDARARYTDLVKCVDGHDCKVYIIDMNAINVLEKAKILYNRIYFDQLPEEYFNIIKCGKKYLKIVMHKNYNPRVIEYIISRAREIGLKDYDEFIDNSLNNPSDVWDDEYTRRLLPVDRILISTLFSLTEKTISAKELEHCFNYRIDKIVGFDKTIDNYKESVRRLNGSMIKLVDADGRSAVMVSNPSINDYMATRMSSNLEKDEILRAASSIRQLKRLLGKDEYERTLASETKKCSIINYYFGNEDMKAGFLTFCVCKYGILKRDYTEYIKQYLNNIFDVYAYQDEAIQASHIISHLVQKKYVDYYKLKRELEMAMFINEYFETCLLDQAILSVKALYTEFSDEPHIERYFAIVKRAIKDTYEDVDANQYSDCFDLDNIIEQSSYYEEYERGESRKEYSVEGASESIRAIIEATIYDEISEKVEELPPEIKSKIDVKECINIGIGGIEEIVTEYLMPDVEPDDDYRDRVRGDYSSEIDDIFNR